MKAPPPPIIGTSGPRSGNEPCAKLEALNAALIYEEGHRHLALAQREER